MRLPAVTFICLSLAACALEQETACTLIAQPAIRVVTLDSITNTPVLSSTGEIVASAQNNFADTVRAAPFNGRVQVHLATERRGTFRVDVNVVGYAPWTMVPVRVEHDGCHVETVDITARLQRQFAPPNLVRDTVPRIQTSTLGYTWTRQPGLGWKVDIPITYRNNTADTIYMVNCNGTPQVSLEKQLGQTWESAITGTAYQGCLSPPVVFPPGVLVRDTFTFFGADPGANMYPQFTTTVIDGVYRMTWSNLVFHYQNSLPFGAPVPPVQQLSNAFVIMR